MNITDTCYSCDFYDSDYECTVHADYKEYVCPDYCGIACVDGFCPKINNIKYSCIDCWKNKGCEDCIHAFDEYCSLR